MPADAYDLAVTTASPEALDAYDRGVRGLLAWDAHAFDHFRAATERDPRLALAHAGAAVCLFLDERFKEAQASAQAAQVATGTQTDRERGHVRALALLISGSGMRRAGSPASSIVKVAAVPPIRTY